VRSPVRQFLGTASVFLRIARLVFLAAVLATLLTYTAANIGTSRGFGDWSFELIIVCSIGLILAAVALVLDVMQHRKHLRELDRIARETREDE
jgi:protein-S-isoprenylcysteine O-methyltransferase Ste14